MHPRERGKLGEREREEVSQVKSTQVHFDSAGRNIQWKRKKTGVQKALGRSQLLLNSKSDSKYITPVSVCMSISLQSRIAKQARNNVRSRAPRESSLHPVASQSPVDTWLQSAWVAKANSHRITACEIRKRERIKKAKRRRRAKREERRRRKEEWESNVACRWIHTTSGRIDQTYNCYTQRTIW